MAARIVGLYTGSTLADLRLLGASADEDLVEAVARRLTKRDEQREPVIVNDSHPAERHERK